MFIGRTDAEAEVPILWPPDEKNWLLKRPWYWERMKAGGEGDRGWYGWMASLTQWTWVWVNSGCWWWTGRPGVLQSMECKESDMTEQLNWLKFWPYILKENTNSLTIVCVGRQSSKGNNIWCHCQSSSSPTNNATMPTMNTVTHLTTSSLLWVLPPVPSSGTSYHIN